MHENKIGFYTPYVPPVLLPVGSTYTPYGSYNPENLTAAEKTALENWVNQSTTCLDSSGGNGFLSDGDNNNIPTC